MAFRRRGNRHEGWAEYRERYAAAYAEAGVPSELLHSEQALAEFLTVGRGEGAAVELESLTDDQFWKLFGLASSRFDDAVGGFTATEARRLRRGDSAPAGRL